VSLCLSAYTLPFPSLHVSPSLFLTRVPPPTLSRVPCRYLDLSYNELTALPATPFNGLTNLR
jgi:hypothetical protein